MAERNGVPLQEMEPLPFLRRVVSWLTLRQRPAIRNKTKPLTELVTELLGAGILTPNGGAAANRIIGSFRNDVHHMNPTVHLLGHTR